ncbi:pirin family protein [bacterium]|nr:pirin family protein [candidate division CSSED10-310 bacterium]
MKKRSIRKMFRSKPTLEGAGVHLKRAFGFSHVPLFDPFLLLDDFRSNVPDHYRKGFPWHPHRGIETITYMLRGSVEHGDSMGNKGVIHAGDIQWMTAGSGIVHQEMPIGDPDGYMWGFQLWANLPASHKMMSPRYQEIKNAEIPVREIAKGVTTRIISGNLQGIQGPVKDIVIDPEYLDITIAPHTTYRHPTRHDALIFAYVIAGKGIFCDEKTPLNVPSEGINYFDLQPVGMPGNETLILFNAGDLITIATEDEPVRFLLIAGQPIKEPIAWYGPIVMNSQEELQTAFEEYQQGTFIKST